jgi:hypothetical protein
MASTILSGWKDIANYMGKGVRTVQRYERELGLPVRRPAGRPKASVLITKAELDVWIHTAFNHHASHEKTSLKSENVRSRVSELAALLEQLKQSLNKLATTRKELATTRDELAISQRTVRDTVNRVRGNVFESRVRWKTSSSRAA